MFSARLISRRSRVLGLLLLAATAAGLLLLLRLTNGPAAIWLGAVSARPGEVLVAPWCPCGRKAARPGRISLSSNCAPLADLRGPGQRVIAYSYYGHTYYRYLRGVAKNAELAARFYPSWTVRIYYDGGAITIIEKYALCDAICRYDHVDLCDVRHLPGLGDLSQRAGSMWRFVTLADDTVERFIVRDLDSLLGQRERDAVDDWIASNFTFHVMRDHPLHKNAMLAGMWGGWNRFNAIYQPFRGQMIAATTAHTKTVDQDVLKQVLWPELLRRRDVLAHDSYTCTHFPYSRPFPTRRFSRADFVGSSQVVYEAVLPEPCPVACRPHQHLDWEWC